MANSDEHSSLPPDLNDIHVPMNDTTCIPLLTYKKLLDDSMELMRANEKIKRLTVEMQKKDELIEKLQRTENTNLTRVSRKVYETNILVPNTLTLSNSATMIKSYFDS